MVLAILWFSYDLPDVHKLQMSVRKPGVIVQAMDGSVIGTYGDLHEDVVRISELPPYVPQALMAVEDHCYQHNEDEEETVAVASGPFYQMLRMLISVVERTLTIYR